MDTVDWTLFLGRWHPVLVHLPIGLVLGLLFLEIVAALRPRKAVVRAAAGPLLILLVPSTLAAALCGWLLAGAGGYDAGLLRLHRLTGLAVAVLAVLMAVAHAFRRSGWYRFLLVVCALALVPAGHYGGSLTHGRDYLAQHAPSWLKPLLGGRTGAGPATGPVPLDPAAFDLYQHGIQPVFDRYCISCHGSEKAKGGLRLDHAAGLWIGGDSGPAIEPGRPEASLLLKRMRLPLDHDEHMPPEGKPQPDPADLELLAWWIAQGAPTNRTLAELTPPTHLLERLRALPTPTGSAPASNAPQPPSAQTPDPYRMPGPEQIHAELDRPGVAIAALAATEPWLQVNAAPAGPRFDDAALERLIALCGPRIRWLDLGGTAVTDAGLRHLRGAPHLERLRLDRTRVTDAGLAELRGLTELTSLNLYGTAVTATGVAGLLRLPRLQHLYLWKTEVTSDAVARLLAQAADPTGTEDRTAAAAGTRSLSIELGAPTGGGEPVTGVPINTICPVSDKLADPKRTLWHEDRLVAFCCDDCRETFRREPTRFTARLAQLAQPPPGQLAQPPSNPLCPVSGRPARKDITVAHDGRLVAFCSEACRDTFAAGPGAFLARLASGD
ncbi:c-type cytochrome domain-containing protein [Limisphaera sp. 4302-co]|uniref:c-type cytochrome domain-containing protein n=1 Tax=Limisphaera sp. 4302-co TaxID=3400417 RepID=UPI003C1FDA81